MKKILRIMTITLLCISFAGCSSRKLVYYGNLGYDLSGVEHDKAVFNVYHSNNENHKWEQLVSFACEPKKGYYYDIDIEGMDNTIRITAEENHVVKDNSEEYYSDDVDSFEYSIDGFEGFIPGFQTFELKDIAGEQLYRLYPISNKGGIYLSDLALDHSYDSNCENIDNILITITIR